MGELRRFRFTIGQLGDYNGHPLVISRTGYTGLLGYEIFCAPEHAADLWDALMTAGEPKGLEPMGLDGLELLRVEAGLAAGGHEFNDDCDPFEAGLGFTINFEKKLGNFVGRAAIERNQSAPRYLLMGLMIDATNIPAVGSQVLIGETPIGTVTSAIKSPAAGHAIAMAKIATDYANEGRSVEVGQLHDNMKRLKAKIVKLPFKF